MEVKLIIQAALNQTMIENMFKRAIAKAVGVSLEHVVKITVLTMNTSSRRLQSNETVTYEVSYEVMVPKSYDVAVIVAKANLIAVDGSSESQMFQQALTDTTGVMEVKSIVSKEAATAVEIESTTLPGSDNAQNKDTEERNWKALAIGGVAILAILICFSTTAILIKRNRSSQASAGPVNGSSDATGLTAV